MKRVLIATALLAIFTLGTLYLRRDNRAVVTLGTWFHSSPNTLKCGDFDNLHSLVTTDAAIACAQTAAARRSPFQIIFTSYGIDSTFSSALIGDSKGHVIELFRSSGLGAHADMLLLYRCDSPARLRTSERQDGLRQMHCADLSPNGWRRDFLLWSTSYTAR